MERTSWRRAQIAPGVTVARALPIRTRRTIGAWCFLDVAGPFDPARGTVMDVGPHPHIGLQTVTWLLGGEVLHRDSLGSEQLIRPGQLNLMTSGAGVVHAEHGERPGPHQAPVHLAQLWVALPEHARHGAASFEHHPTLPTLDLDDIHARVILGSLGGTLSPATVFTPMVGVELRIPHRAIGRVPLDASFEHGLVVLDGLVEVDGEPLAPGELLYTAPGRSSLRLSAVAGGAVVLLLGGEPFAETVLMWWNFVARTREEIEEARGAWLREAFDGHRSPGVRRFAPVVGDPAPPIPPPDLPWRRARATVP